LSRAKKPRVAFPVPVDVVAGEAGAVLGGDLGKLRALQEADLRGGVARRSRADTAGLQHQHLLARSGQQDRSVNPVMAAPTTTT
jgi:hypothetical protein